MRKTVVCLLSWTLLGCPNGGGVATIPVNPGAQVNVVGTYDFQGSSLAYLLRGTVTFEQTGNLVRLTNTTYLNANDRALVGEAVLDGNQLDITLVPENGDPDFSAEVTFVFSEDGETFDVAFSDTNGDMGPLGSYQGTRRQN